MWASSWARRSASSASTRWQGPELRRNTHDAMDHTTGDLVTFANQLSGHSDLWPEWPNVSFWLFFSSKKAKKIKKIGHLQRWVCHFWPFSRPTRGGQEPKINQSLKKPVSHPWGGGRSNTHQAMISGHRAARSKGRG